MQTPSLLQGVNGERGVVCSEEHNNMGNTKTQQQPPPTADAPDMNQEKPTLRQIAKWHAEACERAQKDSGVEFLHFGSLSTGTRKRRHAHE